jgi:CRP-like cAMP-binding protein/Fe-S-cluster-containing hydrogenase component 2/thioredoxin reductase
VSVGERFEIAILGAGPAGLAAGVQAAREGVSHVVLERGELANTVQRYQKGKLVMDEPARLPLHPELPLRFGMGSREEVLAAWLADVRAARVNLRLGPAFEVLSITGEKGNFTIALRDGTHVSCGALIVAIGLQGNIRKFAVAGAGLPHVTYQLDDPTQHADERIVVIGAGDAGIENALALMEQGNQVAIVNRSEGFDRARELNRTRIEAAIRAGKITSYANSQPDRFESGAIVLRTPNGEVRIETDLVIGRLGATPPRAFLEQVGIRFPSEDPSAIPEVSAAFESNVPGIHLIGALTGSPLIKNCMNQGFEVVAHILGRPVIPADEPILSSKFAGLAGTVDENLRRIRAAIPLLSGLTTIQLRELLLDSAVQAVQAGATIFERNDFTDSFFTILSGSVEVLVPEADADSDIDRGLSGPKQRRFELRAGQFFGEGSLLSGRRRSATIRSLTPCVLIETSRLATSKLIKSAPGVKRVIDLEFVIRKLLNLLGEDHAAEIHRLAEAAELRTCQQGEVLWLEGDPADSVYYLRRGAVTVSRSTGGREVVINYVQAGNYVGERALMREPEPRSATLRAAVLTEAIRLPVEAFRPLFDSHSELLKQLARVDVELQTTDAMVLLDRPATDLVEFLMTVGGAETTELLLVDESLCIRCDNCEKACAGTHAGISRLDRESGPSFGSIHVPIACRHCENPKCMTDCPPDAIRRKPDGEVYIRDNCIGCGNCATNCPFGVIQMADLPARTVVVDGRTEKVVDERPTGVLGWLLGGLNRSKETLHIAVKCDLCTNRPDKRAACEESCPTGAIFRVEPRKYVNQILETRE